MQQAYGKVFSNVTFEVFFQWDCQSVVSKKLSGDSTPGSVSVKVKTSECHFSVMGEQGHRVD